MQSVKTITETRGEDALESVLAWRPAHAGGLRRRTEEIQYWRQRSGWFDDDESMREYNKGIYDAYYEVDDDGARSSHRSRAGGTGGKQKEVARTVLKVVAVLVAIGLTIMMFRAIFRYLGSGKREKKDRTGSDSRSRSGRSKSRSRSRSRSRKAGSDYNLMEDDERSKRSSRSKSRSRHISRSRSRSRQRSSSKSRSEKRREEPALEPVLV